MRGMLAIDDAHLVGKSDSVNGLPWHCPADLKLFQQKTLDKSVLVGYNTFELLPTLVDRHIVIDTRPYLPEKTIQSIDWCIGGPKTLRKYWGDLSEVHVSRIQGEYDGDVRWPTIEEELREDFKLVDTIPHEGFALEIWKRKEN